jgi:hypothetical protein
MTVTFMKVSLDCVSLLFLERSQPAIPTEFLIPEPKEPSSRLAPNHQRDEKSPLQA